MRSLVRCICDNAHNPKIAPLALAFGLTGTSNKKDRESCVINIINRLPYYITTTVNGTIHTTPAKLTRKADNLYLASAQNNYFEAIKDVIRNMFAGVNNMLHVAVIAGKYYNSNMQQVSDQKQAKMTAKIAREEAKEAKETAKIEEAKKMLGLESVVTLDTIGLLQAAAIRCKDTVALGYIMQAIDALTK